MIEPLEHRLWSKVRKTEGCWLWEGYIEQGGYGQIRTPSGKLKVHRVSYELLVGPIPEGRVLDHTCYVKHCVNPRHLRPVTQKQNSENLSHNPGRSRSGVRGVTYEKDKGKYRARVRHHYKDIHVGYYDSLEAAEVAAIAKRNDLFTHNDQDKVIK